MAATQGIQVGNHCWRRRRLGRARSASRLRWRAADPAAPVNGHRDDEAPEPQQSLFSWAEFMAEEPVKPKGRKTQAPSLSLFAWAVEQEREEELVGAGR